MSNLESFLLVACVFLLWRCFKLWLLSLQVRARLAIIVDFMSYLEREKHTLPKEVLFNYNKCWEESLKLINHQTRGRKL